MDLLSLLTQRVPRAWPLLRAGLLFALCWGLFTWPWLSGAVAVPWDAKAHFYPQILFLAQAIHDGESPFWTPFVFAGHPQIADPQSLLTAPPILLLAALDPLPDFRAVDMIVFAMLGAGGLAILLIFRDRGWHWAGAVLAALVFCFGASAAWRIQHVGQILSLAWAPIVFVCLDRALRRRSLAYGFLAGVTGAFLVLGRDQVALLAAYLLAARVLGHWLSARRKGRAFVESLPALSLASFAGLATVALPLLMSIAFGALSNRPAIDYASAGAGSLHPVHLLTLFVADLYGSSGPMAEVWGPPSFAWSNTGLFLAQNMFVLYVGAIPLLLLAAGLASGDLWTREAWGFSLAALFVLLYALGWYTPLFRLAYEILPGVDLFRRPADATFLLGALLGVLAGYALHRLLTQSAARPRLAEIVPLLVGAAGFLACLGLALWAGQAGTKALPPLLTGAASLALAALALWAARRIAPLHTGATGLFLIAATLADLAWSNGPTPSTALPPAAMDVLRPDTADPVIDALLDAVEAGRTETRRDRVEMVGLGFFWPNAGLVHGLEHTLGYNPLRLGVYSAATGAIDTIAVPDQRRFPPLFPSYRSELANLLGLRFIVTPEPIEAIDRALPPGALPLIGRPGGTYLYENTNALPRVLLATSAVAADTAELLRNGAWPTTDFTRAVVLERVPDGVPAAPSPMPGIARLVEYGNTEVVVEAFAPTGGGFVVLHDAWHPWWYADIDGRPAEILRANALFRAVRVPEGQSRVRFAFRPFRGLFDEIVARAATR